MDLRITEKMDKSEKSRRIFINRAELLAESVRQEIFHSRSSDVDRDTQIALASLIIDGHFSIQGESAIHTFEIIIEKETYKDKLRRMVRS